MRDDGEEEAEFTMIMRRDYDGKEVTVHVTVEDNAVQCEMYLPYTSDPNLYWGNDYIESPEKLLELLFKTRDGSACDVLHFVRIN